MPITIAYEVTSQTMGSPAGVSCTMPAGITSGDVLAAFATMGNNTVALAGSWTTITSAQNANTGVKIYMQTRVYVGGDSATYVISCNGSVDINVVVARLSGVDPVAVNSYLAVSTYSIASIASSAQTPRPIGTPWGDGYETFVITNVQNHFNGVASIPPLFIPITAVNSRVDSHIYAFNYRDALIVNTVDVGTYTTSRNALPGDTYVYAFKPLVGYDPPYAQCAVTSIAVSSWSSLATNPASIPIPANVQSGDLVVLALYTGIGFSVNPVTTPTSYIAVASYTDSNNGAVCRVLASYYNSGGPTYITVSINNATWGEALAAVYCIRNSKAMWDVNSVVLGSETSDVSSLIDPPSLSTFQSPEILAIVSGYVRNYVTSISDGYITAAIAPTMTNKFATGYRNAFRSASVIDPPTFASSQTGGTTVFASTVMVRPLTNMPYECRIVGYEIYKVN